MEFTAKKLAEVLRGTNTAERISAADMIPRGKAEPLRKNAEQQDGRKEMLPREAPPSVFYSTDRQVNSHPALLNSGKRYSIICVDIKRQNPSRR